MMYNILGLSKKFGELEVLKDISLDIQEGEVVCIIGPSGSGKSTLINEILHKRLGWCFRDLIYFLYIQF